MCYNIAMEFTIILPENFKSESVKSLLEESWLVPRKQRHFLRTKKQLLVNGEKPLWTDEVEAGDRIDIRFEAEDFKELSVDFGDARLAQILYEDEHLVIANKPEGMKTHGNSPGEIAFQNHVAAAVGAPVHIVHRLDKETSGAVLLAKNQFVLPILGKMLEERQIHRTYLALIEGHFSEENLTIDAPIARDRHDKRKRLVAASGQQAITHVKSLENLGRASLVECRLDTGRTHQIRVHLSSRRHAIIGDPLYSKTSGEKRLMLHAKSLSLTQPFTAEKLEVLAPSQSFDERYNQEKADKNQSNR